MVEWDPDGDGPQPSLMVVGGSFDVAGTTLHRSIVAWDGQTWQPIGNGVSGGVSALAVYHGDLIACGYFTSIDGVPMKRIARWNGSAWQPLGSGLTISGSETGPNALLVYNDELIVGGSFSSAGGVVAKGIAKWNGSGWQSMSNSLVGGVGVASIYSLATYGGHLFAGGDFSNINGVSANSIAQWTGTTWIGVGGGVTGGLVRGLAPFGGTLVACGSFTSAGATGTARVAAWNGSSWAALGGGISGSSLSYPYTLTAFAGRLFIGGSFRKTSGSNFDFIAAWDGLSWTDVGPAGAASGVSVSSIAPFHGELLCGGKFTQINGCHAMNLARWNGTAWLRFPPIGDWFDFFGAAPIGSIHETALVSGTVNLANGDTISGLLGWDGVSWSDFGGPSIHSASSVVQMAGDVFVGGVFDVGGVPTTAVAKRLPSEWSLLGTGMNGTVTEVVEYAGMLHAAGAFTTAANSPASRVARWNGNAWESLGAGVSGGSPVRINAIAVYRGELVVGGTFTTAGSSPANNIASWDGSQWKSLGTGMVGTAGLTFVNALAVLNDQLYAAGEFVSAGGVTANGIARWDGDSWHALGTGLTGASSIASLAVFNNALFAGGSFYSISGTKVSNFARWNGSQWSNPGLGLQNAADWIIVHENEILAGGEFTTAGGLVSCYFARWTDTNIPWVSQHPQPLSLNETATLALVCTPANGYSNVSFQWLRNGIPISDGPGGASPGGGTVSGSSGTLPSPTANSPATLTITGITLSDAGDYTCTFTNPCGSVTSNPATVSVLCFADYDANTFVNGVDFDTFVADFELGDAAADVNHDGFVNGVDFDTFADHFVAGC